MPSERKVALITGGASGMGYGLAEHLVQKGGFNVSIVDFNESNGKAAQQKLGAENVLYVHANVTRYDSLASAFVKTWDEWGRLDLVWSNAGIGDRIDFMEPASEGDTGVPPRPDAACVDVCLYGCIYASYLALHFFRKNSVIGGNLVMTSSMAGLYPSSNLTLYSAAKHGVVGLTRSMGADPRLKENNITVNCLCPGLVPTPLAKSLSDQYPEEMLTPVSTMIGAIEDFMNDSSLTGKVAECSGKNVYYIPVKDCPDDAARYLIKSEFAKGTGIDPNTLKKASIADGKKYDEMLE